MSESDLFGHVKDAIFFSTGVKPRRRVAQDRGSGDALVGSTYSDSIEVLYKVMGSALRERFPSKVRRGADIFFEALTRFRVQYEILFRGREDSRSPIDFPVIFSSLDFRESLEDRFIFFRLVSHMEPSYQPYKEYRLLILLVDITARIRTRRVLYGEDKRMSGVSFGLS